MSLIDISFCVHFLKDLLNLFLVVSVCGTDEFVIGCVHQIPDSLDLTGYVVYEFLWCDSCFFCFELDLLTMLVSSCLEKYIVSFLSLVTCDRICQYDLIGIADMRFTGCIGNRGCDIVFLLIHFISSSFIYFIVIPYGLSCKHEQHFNL